MTIAAPAPRGMRCFSIRVTKCSRGAAMIIAITIGTRIVDSLAKPATSTASTTPIAMMRHAHAAVMTKP